MAWILLITMNNVNLEKEEHEVEKNNCKGNKLGAKIMQSSHVRKYESIWDSHMYRDWSFMIHWDRQEGDIGKDQPVHKDWSE